MNKNLLEILGKRSTWTVKSSTPTGYELTTPDFDDLFLPEENASQTLTEDDQVDVFVTFDSVGQVVGDMRIPATQINQPVVLTAKDAAARGAFFDWGTTRDQYVVVPFIDEKSQRILGCTKLKHFFPESSKWLTPKQKVSLTVFAKTDLGYKMLIDNAVLGLLFHSDVHIKLRIGETVSGIVKHIREDGKIDLALSPISKDTRRDLQQQIIDDLDAHDGLSTLTDKSSPEEIHERFQVSKGAYKQALGTLFKAKKIVIEKDVIRLVKNKKK